MTTDPLDLVRLTPLMRLSTGSEDTPIALLDGPVATGHPDLNALNLFDIRPRPGISSLDQRNGAACRHGTFVAGMLSASRGSGAPSLCPDCPLFVRPIFGESSDGVDQIPSASTHQLAEAISDSVRAGARVINVSCAIVGSATDSDSDLREVLAETARRGVVVVAASGNAAMVGCSVLTSNAWVITVPAFSRAGRPLPDANLGRSIGQHGIGAPGERVTSLDPRGGTTTMTGSSCAAPFVTGVVALLWSLFPSASAQDIRRAAALGFVRRRRTITPPMVDAWKAYELLARQDRSREDHERPTCHRRRRQPIRPTPDSPTGVSQ